MQTYISILRGINVSGHKIIKMEELRKMYVGLGFKNVQTYIQSGNVIFQYKKTKLQDLEKNVTKQIVKDFSFEVPVLVKELSELIEILSNNPFINKRKEDVSKLHVTFLSEEPEPANIENIKKGQYASDEFILSGKSVYLFCPNGYGNTKLNNTFFESKLKVTSTTRNWKTINGLVNLAETNPPA
ncbi:MAG TPA: DUF1697 domain-containing protein [Nitrosopumilaceae archaeon]|jgi:uncharacterized protein (DUF1697 family)|nr:DUF1697 domain-containing protein [Nitrosopumilaceae archaeon]